VNSKIRMKNLTLDQLQASMINEGEKKFRARQLIKWIYQKRVCSFDQMNNIPKTVKQKLSEKYSLEKMKPVYVKESSYGDAVKFGFSLIESKHVVESVLLYDGKRRTACISSQLGCALGCVFCRTAVMGLIRNLTLEEIIGQLTGINDYLNEKKDKLITNIVFMGMGEALSNFENFRKSLEIIMHEETFNIGGRRITVSTAGVIPSIEKLMNENLNVGLAISLNAYTNEKRNSLMPVNRKYPIELLVKIAGKFFEKTGRRVTFEYVVIDGENDTGHAVNGLHKLLNALPCKINLIPVNPSDDSKLRAPSDKKLKDFADQLHARGLTVTIRKSRGQDILGACGQLAGSINKSVSGFQ